MNLTLLVVFKFSFAKEAKLKKKSEKTSNEVSRRKFIKSAATTAGIAGFPYFFVKVKESASSSANTIYTQATNIREVNNQSAVYYLQETHDKQYEILFGTGSLGKPVVNGNVIQVEYRVCHGIQTNGANTFSIDNLSVIL